MSLKAWSAVVQLAQPSLCLYLSLLFVLFGCSNPQGVYLTEGNIVTTEKVDPKTISTSRERDQSTLPQITMMGMDGTDQKNSIEAAMRPFEQASGIDVVYVELESFTTRLPERVARGNAPDIAILPQPGMIKKFSEEDQIVPIDTFLSRNVLRRAYPDAWLELGSVNETLYGLFYRVSAKSLVWYNPLAFEMKGYDIPFTWDELIALSDRIVAEGGTPWCIGIESGDISGWPATDWIEDIMLRASGPEAYKQWVNHQLPFTSDIVLNAFGKFEQILRTPGYVSGGAENTANVNYAESPLGLFSDPPECYMHRQANFILTAYPDSAEPRVDYDFFPLPEIDARFGTPLLAAGDAMVMFNDTPETRALMTYLTTPEPHMVWAARGKFIVPHKAIPIDSYPDIVIQRIAQYIQDADVIRFDGSDLMPAEVGTGTFWQGMVDFAQGQSAETVTQEIDESWPR